ncbi:hypothetical protein H0H93_002215, partial [Arthromyces matolae]
LPQSSYPIPTQKTGPRNVGLTLSGMVDKFLAKVGGQLECMCVIIEKEPRVAFIVDMIDDPKATRKKFDVFEYDDYAMSLAAKLFSGEQNVEFAKKAR